MNYKIKNMNWRKKARVLVTASLLLISFSSISYAVTAQLTKVSLIPSPNQTELVFTLTAPTTYKIFTLHKPERLVIDLTQVNLATSFTHLALHSPIIQLREGHPTPDTLRIVIELNRPQSGRVILADNNQLHVIFNNTNPPLPSTQQALQQTQQWVAQNLQQSLATSPTGTSPAPTAKSPASKPSNTLPVSLSPSSSTSVSTGVAAVPPESTTSSYRPHRAIIVVIDPGHGGKDPGTTGPLGIHEKDVVLAISLDLRDILAKQPGYHPVMTRSGDYFIPLRGRLAIARQDHGDMFIAIHADAYQNPYAAGASVYALSAHGASSEAARWLAEKENYSELGDVSLSDKSDMLRSVLIDLSQTATINSSLQLGSSLLQQLNKLGVLHHNIVEQAPFMVLKSPDIPSVLVETGFLSNPTEEERLHNPLDQEAIAAALAKGIENYFAANPPADTVIATNQSTS